MTTTTSVTDIDTPLFDKKTSGLVLAGVLALHGLLAVGLANMTIPDIKPPVVTPPLEITFVTPPPPEVVKPEAIKPEEMPPEEKNPDDIKPKATPTVTPKLTPEPKVEPVKPLPKAEPLPKPEPVIQKVIPPTPTVPIEEQQPPKKPDDKPVKTPEKEPDKIPEKPPEKDPITPPPENRTPEPNQNLLKAQQLAEQNQREENERNRQQADAETARQAQLAQQKAIDEQHERNRQQADADAERKRADDEAKRKAQADAEMEAKAKQDLADKKARAEADAKAKQDLADKKARETNKPVNFSSGEGKSHLIVTPDFHCMDSDTNGKALTASFAYRVSTQGKPESVSIVKRTGLDYLDKQLLQQAWGARFKPFTNAQGDKVVGNLVLPFACTPRSSR